ncbi:hypothetical protein [Alistipes sp.]|uniref:hypothetical protein n=1 Tax=Alistipes sp. TaxID=1872444 RepID=UPI003AF162D7
MDEAPSFFDTRYMLVLHKPDESDTLFLTANYPYVLFKGKFGEMKDRAFFEKIIEERDSIYPSAKIQLVDGKFYFK